MTAPGGVSARRRRRAVAYSPQDRERLARGELPETAELDRRRRSRDALSGPELDPQEAPSWPDSVAPDAPSGGAGTQTRSNDERLRREVPPHWA
ncbi:MAG: transcriptional regulator [Actinomyces sp.]|uniref:transcriptional regulator n=1 Tax=Actinomyces sp. TaxID=29317 RepID=UPI0026DBAEB4|nr:transcriptional regulator [Actinomyces sp.]MDO4244296.1 transcriptional regulator [Actinomyces sp.]